MRRILPLMFVLALAGTTVVGFAQDDTEAEEATADTEDATAAEADAEEADAEEDAIDLDDPAFAGLDSQDYEAEDDDFIPTEEVPADQAIPFPSDI